MNVTHLSTLCQLRKENSKHNLERKIIQKNLFFSFFFVLSDGVSGSILIDVAFLSKTCSQLPFGSNEIRLYNASAKSNILSESQIILVLCAYNTVVFLRIFCRLSSNDSQGYESTKIRRNPLRSNTILW